MARRMLLVSVVCMVLTWGVIYNAFRQKGEFYPSVVYLTKSRPSMAVNRPIHDTTRFNIHCNTGPVRSGVCFCMAGSTANEEIVFWHVKIS